MTYRPTTGHIASIIFAGLLGGIVGAYLASPSSPDPEDSATPAEDNTRVVENSNPFRVASSAFSRSNTRELETRVARLEEKLQTLENGQAETPEETPEETGEASTQAVGFRPVTPSLQNLVESGVSPDMASDIMRRMSQQEYRRLELQNLISRSSGIERRSYQTELRELNSNRISLRNELGDDQYDRYLYSSGQSNRVRVNSVMSGSPAESAGFETGDVILSYGDQKILNWPDIRKVTRQGEIGSYVNIEILRDGQRMSIMVPRGTLGVQLDAIRLDPQL